MAVLLAVLIGMPACSTRFYSMEGIGPEAEDFQPHIESFRKQLQRFHSRIENHTVFIQYVNRLPGRAVGVCLTGEGVPTVFIYKSYFKQLTFEEREQLIWHELGHCVLGRDHDATHLNNGYPTSIMYPVVFGPAEMRYYHAHKDYYERNLFIP